MKAWLYAIAVAIFSILLIAFAHDIEQGISIKLASTNTGKQEMLMAIAEKLGLKGSVGLALVATGISVYAAIIQYRKPK